MRALQLTLTIVLIAYWSVRSQPTAYVVNTSGETLSRINLTTGAVDNDFITVGSDVFSFPNQIVVRGGTAFVVASGTNEIQVIDLINESTIDFIPTGVGSNPYWLTFMNDRIAYASNLVSNEVVKIDIDSLKVVANIPVGVGPAGMIVVEGRLYVAHTGFDFETFEYGQGQVWVIDTDADTVLATVNVGKNPQYLDVDQSGLILVVCTGDFFSSFGVVYAIDPLNDSIIDSLYVGGSPGQISIGPDNIAYIAAGGFDATGNGYVYAIDADTRQVLRDVNNPIIVDSGCLTAVVFQDSTCFVGAFEDSIKSIDVSGNVFAAYAVGDGPVHIDFNYIPGDINGNWVVDISDLTYLVAYMFKSGPAPVWPRWRGNINGHGPIDIPDLTYLVSYSFKGGPPPRIGENWRR